MMRASLHSRRGRVETEQERINPSDHRAVDERSRTVTPEQLQRKINSAINYIRPEAFADAFAEITELRADLYALRAEVRGKPRRRLGFCRQRAARAGL